MDIFTRQEEVVRGGDIWKFPNSMITENEVRHAVILSPRTCAQLSLRRAE